MDEKIEHTGKEKEQFSADGGLASAGQEEAQTSPSPKETVKIRLRSSFKKTP